MTAVNFSHPTTEQQRKQIESLTKAPVERVIDVPAHFDEQQTYEEQARRLVDSAGLSGDEWQTLPLVVNLPSLNVIAGLVLAEIHGRAGYFPAVLRLRPVEGAAVRQFEVAEILNLQAVRDRARQRREGE